MNIVWTKDEYSDEYSKGQVCEQYPAAGETTYDYDEIKLTLSAGRSSKITLTPTPTPSPSPTPIDSDDGLEDQDIRYKGIATERVNVRTGPGNEYDKVTLPDGTPLQLDPQEEIVIIGEAISSNGKVFYHLIVTRDGIEYTGYSTSSYVSKLGND